MKLYIGSTWQWLKLEITISIYRIQFDIFHEFVGHIYKNKIDRQKNFQNVLK